MGKHTAIQATPTKERLLSLDVLRGVALCGIAFVNVIQLWGVYPLDPRDSIAWTWLNMLFHERFFPIFSLLFGIGFAMIVRSAQRRGLPEWKVLLRRLVPLFVLGHLHGMLHDGEALEPYAVIGLFVLWPLTFVKHEKRGIIALVLGVLLAAVGAWFGGVMLIPGMFLLGFAATEWSVPQSLDANAKKPVVALLILLPIGVVAGYIQYLDRAKAGYSSTSSIVGVIHAALWIALVLVIMHTPLRRVMAAVFAPLGRMALTNYIGATLVMVAAKPFLAPPEEQLNSPDSVFYQAWALVIVMLLLQSVISTLWLKKFKQGPLEKGWRWLTWGSAGKTPSPSQPQPPAAPTADGRSA